MTWPLNASMHLYTCIGYKLPAVIYCTLLIPQTDIYHLAWVLVKNTFSNHTHYKSGCYHSIIFYKSSTWELSDLYLQLNKLVQLKLFLENLDHFPPFSVFHFSYPAFPNSS